MNLQRTAKGYNFTSVAEWHFDQNQTDIAKNFHWTSKIIWNSGHSDPPQSVCSKNCRPGEALEYFLRYELRLFGAVVS